MMSKSKRTLALGLCAALALTITACSGGKDATALVATAGEKLAAATSLNASYHTEMTYTMGEENATSLNTMDITMLTAPGLRVKSDIAMEMTDVAAQKMTMYLVEEDGVQMQYLTDGADWFKAPAGENAADRYNVWESMNRYLAVATDLKAEGDEQVDGKDATKVTGAIAGEELVKVLEDSGVLAAITSMSQDQQTKIKTDLGGIPALTISLWIAKDEGYPVKFEMDLTKTLVDVQTQISKTLGGYQPDESATLTGAVIRITCASLNSAADFELPAEAADAQEAT